MLCKSPYMKLPNGVSISQAITTPGALDAATPYPCGQCLNCRINKGREWQHRLLLEQASHADSVFVTLTYDDDHISVNGELNREHTTQFLKSLRNQGKKYRYFLVGEYGNQSGRPHYHCAIFGLSSLEASCINKAWGHGFVHVGELTKDSAAYITGYTTEKLTSERMEWIGNRESEFMRCSRMPAIGTRQIRRIGERLRKERAYDGRRITDLPFGKHKMPIGRTLSMKMDEYLDQDGYQKKIKNLQYQIKCLDQGLDQNLQYRDAIISKNKPKSKGQEIRFKAHTNRRSQL